jgi:hypothetical protein
MPARDAHDPIIFIQPARRRDRRDNRMVNGARDQRLCVVWQSTVIVDRFTKIRGISKQSASRLATRDEHCFREEIFSQPFH